MSTELADGELNESSLTLIEPQSSIGPMVRAEIDSQIATAKQYPRRIRDSLKNAIALATMTEGMAQSCIYALPRGGKVITGPSVRLAEIVAGCWGNMRFGARTVDDDGKMITVQGFAHDLETNTAFAFDLKARVTDKRGNRYSEDMVIMATNAASSKALRNAIFKVVPRALVDEILAAAQKVAKGDEKTFSKRRADAMAYFKKQGVAEAKVLALCGKHTTDDLDGSDLANLVSLVTSIKEGELTLAEAFPEPEKPRHDPIADKLNLTPKNPEPPADGTLFGKAGDERRQLDATK